MTSMALTPNDKYLFFGSNRGILTQLDITFGRVFKAYDRFSLDPITLMKVTDDSGRLFIFSQDIFSKRPCIVEV